MDLRATAIISAGDRLGALGEVRDRLARTVSACERTLLAGLAGRVLGWPSGASPEDSPQQPPYESQSAQGAGPRYLI
jgi:hypothetical protein